MATLLKKIGAKQILGNVAQVVVEVCPKDGDTFRAYSIWGRAHGVETGTSQFGEWVAFVGRMGAVNYHTGEEFEGMKAFIPDPLQTLLREGLEKNDEIEFALSVIVKRRDDLKEGYEYLVEAHKEAQEANPLDGLKALLPPPPIKDAPLKEEPKKAPKK